MFIETKQVISLTHQLKRINILFAFCTLNVSFQYLITIMCIFRLTTIFSAYNSRFRNLFMKVQTYLTEQLLLNFWLISAWSLFILRTTNLLFWINQIHFITSLYLFFVNLIYPSVFGFCILIFIVQIFNPLNLSFRFFVLIVKLPKFVWYIHP